MRKFQVLMVAALLFSGVLAATTAVAGYGRCYYSSWSYYPQRSYYYCNCNYQPYVNSDSYSYHYCVYVPTQPRYCYYYNPGSQTYWGRYDLESKGYSMLAEKDRKQSLKDIPETAFPKPGAMPTIPGAKDDLKLEVPPAPPADDKPGN